MPFLLARISGFQFTLRVAFGIAMSNAIIIIITRAAMFHCVSQPASGACRPLLVAATGQLSLWAMSETIERKDETEKWQDVQEPTVLYYITRNCIIKWGLYPSHPALTLQQWYTGLLHMQWPKSQRCTSYHNPECLNNAYKIIICVIFLAAIAPSLRRSVCNRIHVCVAELSLLTSNFISLIEISW